MQIHHPIPHIASANLYARPFMLAQEELVLFYFDNFNEVFNVCFVCLFCLVNYKKKITKKKKKKKKKKL